MQSSIEQTGGENFLQKHQKILKNREKAKHPPKNLLLLILIGGRKTV